MSVTVLIACPECGLELQGRVSESGPSTLDKDQIKLRDTCTWWAQHDANANECPHLQEAWDGVQQETKGYLK